MSYIETALFFYRKLFFVLQWPNCVDMPFRYLTITDLIVGVKCFEVYPDSSGTKECLFVEACFIEICLFGCRGIWSLIKYFPKLHSQATAVYFVFSKKENLFIEINSEPKWWMSIPACPYITVLGFGSWWDKKMNSLQGPVTACLGRGDLC